mgnify:CR=1 FL=1
MSTHSVPIIRINTINNHPNADSLELIPVGGWQAVVKKGQFKTGDLAVYIQPDYMVPTAHPAFSFLAREGKDMYRLRAIRLRGELSFGLLVPFNTDLQAAGFVLGDDVMEHLGIARYEPPMSRPQPADQLAFDQCPQIPVPRFDLESYNNFPDLLQEGELVIVTEKIHGANAKYVFHNGTFFMGSRGRWLRPDKDHAWSRACTDEMKAWCELYPDTVLYGEVYGAVQSLKYGIGEKGVIKFAAFAAYNAHTGHWWSLNELFTTGLPMVPHVATFPWVTGTDAFLWAEDDSTVETAPPGHMREGLVFTPVKERRAEDGTRVALKYISTRYWTGKDA